MRNPMTWTLCLITVVWLSAAAGVAQAAFTWQARNTSGSPTSNFDATPGSTVTVDVYLLETFTTASDIAAENGMFSISVQARRTASTTGNPASIGSPTDLSPNAGFDDTGSLTRTVNTSTGIGGIQALRDFLAHTAGVTGTTTGTEYAVFAASIDFDVPNQPGEVSTFILEDFNPIPGDQGTVTWNGTPLDSAINTSNFTITAIPEPATLSMLGLASATLAMRRRKRIESSRTADHHARQ